MKEWKQITAEELSKTPFELIGKDWMLVTAQKPDGEVNTMTASWGGLGVLWGKNVAFVVIRPQRYTKEFIDAGEHFSLSFLPEQYREQLSYLGKVSGRDEDKIAKSGLHVVGGACAPYFEEARLVLLCRKLYAQKMEEDAFLDKGILARCYPTGDYHTLYVAEIETVLEQK